MKTLKDLEKIYKIDFEKIISEIKSKKLHRSVYNRKGRENLQAGPKLQNKGAKLVLLQFADGLKPYATAVVDYLEGKCIGVEFLIWLGDCFGACDTPIGIDNLNVDLIVQVGHNSLQPKI